MAPTNEASKILSEYASDVLNEILENSIYLWLPHAKDFNKGQRHDPTWQRPQIKRLSVAFFSPDPTGNTQEDVEEAEQRPELIFSAATLKAIEFQDVSNAHRFSAMALRADGSANAKGNAIEHFSLELTYLNAVTTRLLITTAEGHLRAPSNVDKAESMLAASRSLRDVHNAFRRASEYLDVCFTAHFDEAQEDPYHAVRYLRTLSERASLHLFMATSLGLAQPEFTHLRTSSLNRYLDIARGDLRRCIEMDLKFNDMSDLMVSVRNQFIPNIAGYEVLKYLVDPDNYAENEWQRKALRLLHGYWEEERNPHGLLAAELSGYYHITGRSPPPGRKISKRDNRQAGENLRLPLDRVLFRAIHKRVLDDYE
jgi:hypothetical protein